MVIRLHSVTWSGKLFTVCKKGRYIQSKHLPPTRDFHSVAISRENQCYFLWSPKSYNVGLVLFCRGDNFQNSKYVKVEFLMNVFEIVETSKNRINMGRILEV